MKTTITLLNKKGEKFVFEFVGFFSFITKWKVKKLLHSGDYSCATETDANTAIQLHLF